MAESNRVYQVSLLVYCVVQGVWGLGQLIWMAFRLDNLNAVLYPNSDVSPVTTATTRTVTASTSYVSSAVTDTTNQIFSSSSTPASNLSELDSVFSDRSSCDELIDSGILRSYYILVLSISVTLMVLTSLLIYALKIKSKSLLKSFLDIDSSLTLILLLIYILTIGHGLTLDKEFFALYGFFIVLRLLGLYLTSKTYLEFSKEQITFPRVEFRANAPDSISASTTTLNHL